MKKFINERVGYMCHDCSMEWQGKTPKCPICSSGQVEPLGVRCGPHDVIPQTPRGRVLAEAALVFSGDHSPPAKQFSMVSVGWSQLFGCEITPRQVAWAMAWWQACRDTHKPERDNLVEAAGFIACAEDVSSGDE